MRLTQNSLLRSQKACKRCLRTLHLNGDVQSSHLSLMLKASHLFLTKSLSKLAGQRSQARYDVVRATNTLTDSIMFPTNYPIHSSRANVIDSRESRMCSSVLPIIGSIIKEQFLTRPDRFDCIRRFRVSRAGEPNGSILTGKKADLLFSVDEPN